MHQQGLVDFEPDARDGRVRHAVFTAEGRSLHDRIIRLALAREEAAVAVLGDAELATLRELLRRVHANLPNVEHATAEFCRSERLVLGLPGDGPPLRRRGSAVAPPPPAAVPATRTPTAKSRRVPRR